VLLLRTTPLAWPARLPFLRDTWPLLGWPDGTWKVAIFDLTLPAGVVIALCIVRTAAAVAFTIGWHTRPAGLIAGASAYLVLAQDAFTFSFTQHLLYLGAIVLSLTDAGSTFALRPDPARAPESSLALARAWTASIYPWAAIIKLRPDWLDGRTLMLFHAERKISGPLADVMLATPARAAVAATTVVLVELSLAPLLLLPRTRRLGLVLAFGIHAVFEIMATPELIGWGMAALLLCFLPPPPQRAQRAASAGQTISP
jgi:hypothetical protein